MLPVTVKRFETVIHVLRATETVEFRKLAIHLHQCAIACFRLARMGSCYSRQLHQRSVGWHFGTQSLTMETTERIVEAYVRYVKHWATIPNIKCKQQGEIDLFAIDPVTNRRYHIETSVSISGGFSPLTAEPFEADEYKNPVRKAAARRKLDYFVKRKFSQESVDALKELGCRQSQIGKVIVSWGWKDGVEDKARKHGIEVWDFRDIMREHRRVWARQCLLP